MLAAVTRKACHMPDVSYRRMLPLLAAGVVAFAASPALAQAEPEGEKVASNIYVMVLQNIELISASIMLCSVLAVTLIIRAVLRARRVTLLPDESVQQINELITQRNFRGLIEYTDTDASFLSAVLNPALKQAPNGFSAMKETMESAIADQTAEEFRKLEPINLLSNIGPLLGLLGTVIGIMQAFLDMRKAGGSAAPDQLAGGISVALGTTMLGLFLAIPCLVAYTMLRNKVDRLTGEGALQAEEFLLMMKPDGKPASSSGRSSSSSSSTTSSSRAAPTPA